MKTRIALAGSVLAMTAAAVFADQAMSHPTDLRGKVDFDPFNGANNVHDGLGINRGSGSGGIHVSDIGHITDTSADQARRGGMTTVDNGIGNTAGGGGVSGVIKQSAGALDLATENAIAIDVGHLQSPDHHRGASAPLGT